MLTINNQLRKKVQKTISTTKVNMLIQSFYNAVTASRYITITLAHRRGINNMLYITYMQPPSNLHAKNNIFTRFMYSFINPKLNGGIISRHDYININIIKLYTTIRCISICSCDLTYLMKFKVIPYRCQLPRMALLRLLQGYKVLIIHSLP